MKKLPLGKWLNLWATLLAALSVYEFCTRVDAMWGPLKMFMNMAIGEKIPLERVVRYVDVSIFIVPLFMVLCLLSAALTLTLGRRQSGSLICAVFCLALLGYGLTLKLTLLGEMVRFLKLLPLLALSALSSARFGILERQRRQQKKLLAAAPPRLSDPPKALYLPEEEDNVVRRRRSHP
ncbi:MAG: hypothetical protein MJ136_05945 [Clostridia bacterium]|nr:hypothetical protein [Clostridia bacterium]